jgi:HNH endonuclease
MDQQQLRAYLAYDPQTGVFTWKKKAASKTKIGSQAGYSGKLYTQIRLEGKLHYAHRLAFLYMTGTFPVKDVDHINGVPTDNRWSNLRAVSSKENTQNAAISSNNTSGPQRSPKWTHQCSLKRTLPMRTHW